MPRGRSDLSDPPIETAAGLRQVAARARRLAPGSLDRQDFEVLTEFAWELETRAAALKPAPQTFSHDAAKVVQRAEHDADQQRNRHDERRHDDA
jgi:hypothetical protein